MVEHERRVSLAVVEDVANDHLDAAVATFASDRLRRLAKRTVEDRIARKHSRAFAFALRCDPRERAYRGRRVASGKRFDFGWCDRHLSEFPLWLRRARRNRGYVKR